VIREATDDDKPLIEALWREFEAEVPDLPWRDDDEDPGASDLVLLEGEDGIAAITRHARYWFLDLLYVRRDARDTGVGRALLEEATRRAAEAGVEAIELEVFESNDGARRLYDRLGFRTVDRTLALSVARAADGPTYGAVHVQDDDVDKVRRNAQKVLRTEPPVKLGSGWVRVDADPDKLRTLARELSFTSGVAVAVLVDSGAVVRYVLFDRGSVVDEYASVPEFHGPLPPGDVVALGANATVVARLTGADPQRVRQVARTASSPSELPPADELYRQICELLGVEC
jgi:GNAT superfamily N-acetyltransferase